MKALQWSETMLTVITLLHEIDVAHEIKTIPFLKFMTHKLG